MAQISPLLKIVVLTVGLWLAIGSTGMAQAIPACAAVGDKGNSYDNCTGDTCERMVCNGTAFVPIEIWNNTGSRSTDLMNDTSTCDASRQGRLSYNNSTDTLCYCSGVRWYKIAGAGNSCTTPTGDVKCWGNSANGRLGTGGVTTGPFSAVGVGGDHTCALKTNGDAQCWGLNTSGQAPPAGRTGPFTMINSGNNFTCALRNTGDAECWGAGGGITLGPFSTVSGGGMHTCALKPNGDAQCWGTNTDGQANNQTGPFTAIAAGGEHTCAIRSNGNAFCWGKASIGQAAAQTGPFTKIDAGSYHNCALRVNGDVLCWGNLAGTRVGPFIDITTGGDAYACALKTNGDTECWGNNGNGQATNQIGPFTAISAGVWGTHTCAL